MPLIVSSHYMPGCETMIPSLESPRHHFIGSSPLGLPPPKWRWRAMTGSWMCSIDDPDNDCRLSILTRSLTVAQGMDTSKFNHRWWYGSVGNDMLLLWGLIVEPVVFSSSSLCVTGVCMYYWCSCTLTSLFCILRPWKIVHVLGAEHPPLPACQNLW